MADRGIESQLCPHQRPTFKYDKRSACRSPCCFYLAHQVEILLGAVIHLCGTGPGLHLGTFHHSLVPAWILL